MSLVVWLPLTKDTRQQGLSNISVTGSPASWGNGKLGKCATWNGAVGNVLYNNTTDFNYTNNFSVAFWANPVYTGSTAQYAWTVGRADAGGYGYGFQITSTTAGNFRFGSGSYSVSAPSNEWHHYVMTIGNNKVLIYKDGIQVGSGNLPGTIPTYSDGSGIGLGCFHYASGNIYPYYGSLNDFRIYDHCLSPMEVKELAKGLVLHYPLNRQGWGQENLLKYTKVNATNQNLLKTNVTSSWNNLTLTTKDGYDCYLYPSAQSSTWFASGSWYSGMKANTTYTYTAWIYFTANASFTFTSLGHFQVYNSASTASDKAHEDVVSARIYEPSTIVANTWTKVRITFTTNNLANSYFVIYPRYNIGANVGDLYFRDCKLEESPVPTLWCPHSVDSEYSVMGLNSTTEYDCSGFCNNGEKIGALTYTSDTPKYSVSTHIGATNQKIHISNFPTSGFGNSYSFAWWAKVPSFSGQPMMWGFSDGIRFNAFHTGPYWNTGDSQNNPIYSSGTTLAPVPSGGIWHHFVAVGDGSTCKAYLDGQFWGQAKTYKSISGTSIYINGWDSGSSYTFSDLSISDFRVYATALSATDILALYQNSAYIDSSGNVYGAVHSEV